MFNPMCRIAQSFKNRFVNKNELLLTPYANKNSSVIDTDKNMDNWDYKKLYNVNVFRKESAELLKGIDQLGSLEDVREILLRRISQLFRSPSNGTYPPAHKLIRMRDCSLALHNVFSERSETVSGFNAVQAVWDIAKGKEREDLSPAFYAEMINWVKGIKGRAGFQFLFEHKENDLLSGREKAVIRSAELDQIAAMVEERMDSYANGLTKTAVRLRLKQRDKILEKLGADETDWNNWKWHLKNVISDADSVRNLMEIDPRQHALIMRAREEKLPFGITPYYLSLMEEGRGVNDQAIRAQVFPPEDYITHMIDNRKFGRRSFDFMLESDTSPVDLITRRYPNVVILKPVKTCPQICVYCQRNWEIEQVLAPNSVAHENEIETAVEWIRSHPAVKEVLVTGGDPFILPDSKLESLLGRLCEIDHIDCIRIGSRVLVTLPMRITDKLADILGRFRVPGRREIAVVTHIEHPYEITPDTVRAVDKLKRQGISVYNQQVYTFYTSRRFESTLLRMLLRRIGIDPYYTFMPKGKEETNAYRVPLARILQEQKEEARLVPGLRRTDDAVFNIPGLGKNYLLARQHRDLLTILPNGSRLYEFHPWDMNLVSCDTYLYEDVTILDYLKRLAEAGEDPKEYDSIWFFL